MFIIIPDTIKDLNYYGGRPNDFHFDNAPIIATAIADSMQQGGNGKVIIPNGVWYTSNITITTNATYEGAGYGTVLTLLPSANQDIFSAQVNNINLTSAPNTGVNGGVYGFSIKNMVVDGNKSNQSGLSYPIRFYGFDFTIENVKIVNGYSGGWLSDWNGGGTTFVGPHQMEASIVNMKVHDCGGNGIWLGGPHDTQLTNVLSFRNNGHNFIIANHNPGTLMTNCHAWGASLGGGNVNFLVESGLNGFSNCVAEGSDTMNVVFLASTNTWKGGQVFGTSGIFASSNGFQLGQAAGLTPYHDSQFQAAGLTTQQLVSGCVVDTDINNCAGPNGSIWFAKSNGSNQLFGSVFQTAGNYFTGSDLPSDIMYFSASGLTADGSKGKGGIMKASALANRAFTVTDPTQADVFNVNSSAKRVDFPGTSARFYTANDYATPTVNIQAGTIGLYQSASAAVLASNGTITTTGVSIARVNPAAPVTGVILQSGTFSGQIVHVRNESTNLITFDVSGTSKVANGVSGTVPGNTSKLFEWSGSLWYGVN
jgi:hypothetical protein